MCGEKNTEKKTEFQKEFNKSSCLVLPGFSTEETVYYFFGFLILYTQTYKAFLKLVSKFKKKTNLNF